MAKSKLPPVPHKTPVLDDSGLLTSPWMAWCREIRRRADFKAGTAVLVGGTATVAAPTVDANSLIFLTSQVNGGTPGWLRVTAKTAGTSFVITSSSGADTSTVAWLLLEST